MTITVEIKDEVAGSVSVDFNQGGDLNVGLGDDKDSVGAKLKHADGTFKIEALSISHNGEVHDLGGGVTGQFTDELSVEAYPVTFTRSGTQTIVKKVKTNQKADASVVQKVPKAEANFEDPRYSAAGLQPPLVLPPLSLCCHVGVEVDAKVAQNEGSDELTITVEIKVSFSARPIGCQPQPPPPPPPPPTREPWPPTKPNHDTRNGVTVSGGAGLTAAWWTASYIIGDGAFKLAVVSGTIALGPVAAVVAVGAGVSVGSFVAGKYLFKWW